MAEDIGSNITRIIESDEFKKLEQKEKMIAMAVLTIARPTYQLFVSGDQKSCFERFDALNNNSLYADYPKKQEAIDKWIWEVFKETQLLTTYKNYRSLRLK